MIRTTLASTVVAFATVAAIAVGGAAAASPGGAHVCGTVAGARWQLPGKTGSEYAVLAYPASLCSLAKQAVPRLTGATAPFGQKLPAGPTGFACHALRLPPKTGTPNGTCVNARSGSSGFIWAPGRS